MPILYFRREEEGRDLLGKRTMDFKVTYLDAGLTSTYFSDGETPPSNGSSTPAAASGTTPATKVPKRYKAHLRDFLSSCRGKRAKHTHHSPSGQKARPFDSILRKFKLLTMI